MSESDTKVDTARQETLLNVTSTDKLKPGIYKILNYEVVNKALDLSAADNKTVIAFPEHGWANQQWEFARLGAGYSIRSVHNGQYLTIETSMQDVVANIFPVSWAFESDTFETDVWRICWPNSPFLFKVATDGSNKLQLWNRYPFEQSKLWRLLPVYSGSSAEHPVVPEVDGPVTCTADSTIDAEGLKLGGNGELVITTTTTTTTVTVTKVKKLNPT